MERRLSIAIVGGGVVGLTCAYRLQQDGWQTTLIDHAPPLAPASWGNAGHIAIEQCAPLSSYSTIAGAIGHYYPLGGAMDLVWKDSGRWIPFLLKFGLAASLERYQRGKAALTHLAGNAMPAWRRLVADLGCPGLLREDGHYIVWEKEASARKSSQNWLSGQTEWATAHRIDVSELQTECLKGLRPAGALRFEGTGQIRSLPDLKQALLSGLTISGAKRLNDRVTAITGTATRATIETQSGAGLHFDAVLIAGGAWSGPLLRKLGFPVPLVGERGYHLHFTGSEALADGHPPIVFEDRSVIVTRFADGVRIASFVEFGSPDSPPDQGKWRRLQKHADDLGIGRGITPEKWFGSRPTLPDYLPAMGRLSGTDNIFYAFGHNHLGLTLAPLTAELLQQEIAGTRPHIDLTPYAISRFS